MVQVGQLLRDMKDHPSQNNVPLRWMIENVVTSGDDLQEISNAIGISPLQLNAHYFSCASRDRHYYLNYPIDGAGIEFELPSRESRIESGLDDGWQGLSLFPKSNTPMASHGRLDDDRMLVIKSQPDDHKRYEKRTMNVAERERLMGLPPEYVSKPCKYCSVSCGLLHKSLFQMAFLFPFHLSS